MKILSINTGSSSLKFKLFDMKAHSVIASLFAERIGFEKGRIEFFSMGHDEKMVFNVNIPDHKAALSVSLRKLLDSLGNTFSPLAEIKAVGHRVVHGGDRFIRPALIDKQVIEAIEDCSHMAPLHNPHNLEGIRASMEIMPGIPNVAVFDTAFHQSIPPEEYIFPLPYEVYSEMGIRRYGFHGISHKYVAQKAAELIGKSVEEINVITCHLGNGSSITAVSKGKSIATSLGYGTVGGVMMGTRPGDFDPSVLIELLENRSMGLGEVKTVLYSESGLLGVSGVSNDIRDIEESARNGNARAKLSLELFAASVRKYIGAYAVSMGKLDAVIFTAGIGEKADKIREMICCGLEAIGAELDPGRNSLENGAAVISSDKSKVLLLVVPTDEELMIAMETTKILAGS
ncbi:acetate/propionate family kinase [Thermodesulfobacteriota bacterium]